MTSYERWWDDAKTDPIHEAAADWFARLEDSNVPVEDVVDWKRWMQADPRHAAAFERIEEAWRVVGGISPQKTNKERLRTPWLAVAASAVLVAIGIGWFALRTGSSLTAGVVHTAVGENRALRLADGSEVILGGATTVRVALDAHARDVEIAQGEALFSVAKDPGRSFTVHAGTTTVVALGTEFNVRRADQRTVVAVLEGRVAIESAETQAIKLAAGEQTVVSPAGAAVPTRLRDPAAAISWRKGLLSFHGEPLRDVLEDVNRYAPKPIAIQDDSIGDLLITGTVMSDNVPEWVASLENAFALQASEEPSRITLHRRTGRTVPSR